MRVVRLWTEFSNSGSLFFIPLPLTRHFYLWIMPKILFVLTLLAVVTGCKMKTAKPASQVLSSPDGKLNVTVFLTANGTPAYMLKHEESMLLDTSLLGLRFSGGINFTEGFEISGTEVRTIDETWTQPWGEQRQIRDHGNELLVKLNNKELPERSFSVRFRAYDDGVAFRYEFPQNIGNVVLQDEDTEFNLTADHLCWWGPGDWDITEHLYTTSRFSEIDATKKRNHPSLAQTYIPENAVNTPITMRTSEGLYLAFHEAALINYSDMTLKVDTQSLLMQAELVGRADGMKADLEGPFNTPWRMIQVAERAGDLIESSLILNLNEPNKIGDVSYFKPTKYAGIWWDMHLGRRGWDMEGGNHGATTAYAKEMMDFAAANNIGAILVEGWNTGWASWFGDGRPEQGPFDFVTPYPDYDLAEVVRYGREKGVDLIMHHETSSMPLAYEKWMDSAFALMQYHGIHTVKTGYVGTIIPKGEYHHGQFMINHFRKVVEHAATFNIAVNAHEPIKDTGTRRTWPNEISREGLRGQEFNAWCPDGGNPPEHASIVAFTRMLGGPIDYTPGIFDIKLKPYKPDNQVNTTLAQQLALYVVFYGPVQMVPDLLENYQDQPGLQFIRDVAVDWEQTRVLSGEPGDFVVIARQQRSSDRWFLGAVSDENARTLDVSLDFLEPGKRYTARIYRDGEGAHWNDNPTSLAIEEREVDAGDLITLALAPGGGAAISFIPVSQ